MECARCGGFLANEASGGFVDNVRERSPEYTMCELWVH